MKLQQKSLCKKIILSSPHPIPSPSCISNIFKSYICPFPKGEKKGWSLYNSFSILSYDLLNFFLQNHLFMKQEVHITETKAQTHTHTRLTCFLKVW